MNAARSLPSNCSEAIGPSRAVRLQQREAEGFDFAALLPDPFAGNLQVQVDIQHEGGFGAGLIFAAERPDTLTGAHMVRFLDEDDSVMWGYFTAEGFEGQGSASLDGLDVNPQAITLQIAHDGEQYFVVVDGVLIAGEIPLQSGGQYLGVTASNTIAQFDNLVVEYTGVPDEEAQ